MLILPDWLVVGAGEPPLAGHGLRVVDGVVVEVARHADLLAGRQARLVGEGSSSADRGGAGAAAGAEEVIDAAGQVVLPGFVNAHVHLYGTLAHGIPAPAAGGPTDFWSFLDDYWWPQVEDALDVDMIAAATDYVCAEMLRSGTTAFYDILEAPNALPGALARQKEIVERHGLRGRLSFEATERAGPELARLALAENTDLIDSCGPDDLVQGIMCWHTTFTCSADYITEAVGLARDRGVRYHAHLNEGVHEGQWAEERLGVRTVEYYDRLGVAGPDFVASQCVQITEQERELLAERGVRVTHMPLANCEVGGGIAPIPELAAAGATIGLGSDGYVNDLYEVMRGAFLIHKARLQDPGIMPAHQVLAMATEGGAQALGLDRVGRLEPGWAADLQVVDAAFPTPITEHNLAEQLVLWRNQSHVRHVMVDGRWRVRHGELVDADLDELRARSREQAQRLWAASP